MNQVSDYFLPSDNLQKWIESILLAAGYGVTPSRLTAEGLVLASLRGVDSHGVQLLPHYVKALAAGRIEPDPEMTFERTASSCGVLDAGHGLGFSAGVEAVRWAREMAQETGFGAVSVRQSTHGGMLAYYTLPPARDGFLALAVTNTTPRLIPDGASRAFFGTNPLCYAVPMAKEDPLCFDSATTQITGNKIKLHRRLDKLLPVDTATDIHGISTCDPHKAELLRPFGGYKGMGIAMLVDILCGVLTGMPNGDQVSQMYGQDISGRRNLGQFFLVCDLARFRPAGAVAQELQEEVTRLRALGQEHSMVLAPGDPEKQAHAERIRDGIPIPQEILKTLNSAASSVGVKQWNP